MNRSILFFAIIFSSGSLFACTANAAPTKSASSTEVLSALPSAIEYTRVGGIAGFNDSLKIDARGHALVSRRSGKAEFDVDEATLKKIASAFQAASFAAIPEDSMPRAMPADAFAYTLIYQGHTVKTADSAVPRTMQNLLDTLDQIINAAK